MSFDVIANSLYSQIASKIDSETETFANVSRDIWSHPELNFQETYAHELLTNTLEKLGFIVTRHYGLDTAFRAEFIGKGGDKPVIAVLAEYDALPGLGHGCGHNLIAETAIVAGVGIKAALESDNSVSGKIVVLGCPAEEGGGGKIDLIKYGAFKDVDICMMVHPSPMNLIFTPFIGFLRFNIKFIGVSAHASAFPWQAVNPLDAAVQCYNAVSMLRQQIKPSCRIHGIISNGGILPNIIPSETEMKYYIRGPTTAEIESLQRKLEACIKGAAESTSCKYEIEVIPGYKHLISNYVAGKQFQKHAESLGIQFQDEDPYCEKFVASSDVGDVSHEVPTIHPSFYIGTLEPNHSTIFTQAAGSDTAQPYTVTMGRIMAMTGIDFMINPELVEKAKRRHQDDLVRDKLMEKYML